MFRSRRAWLLFPLLLLTLFFAACGWRNAHLSWNKYEVWTQSALYAINRVAKPVVWALGFSERDARQLEKRNPKLRLVLIKTTEMPSDGGTRGMPWVYVKKPVLQNLFHATSEVSFGDPAKDDMNTLQRDSHEVTLVFTRSPLAVWDNTWHIARADAHK